MITYSFHIAVRLVGEIELCKALSSELSLPRVSRFRMFDRVEFLDEFVEPLGRLVVLLVAPLEAAAQFV